MKSSLSTFFFYGLWFWCHLNIFCLTQGHRDVLFSSKTFTIVLCFTCRSVIHSELTCIWCELGIQVFFLFNIQKCNCSNTLCWKILSPFNCFGSFVKNHLIVSVRFISLCNLMIHMYILKPVLQSFVCCGFIVNFEIGEWKWNFVLLFQTCFDCSWSFEFSCKF